MRVRSEESRDRAAIHSLNTVSFGRLAEADLVDALRDQANPLVSLVAEIGDTIVGHILFSPVSVIPFEHLRTMALGPMAVAPEHQRKGVGSALVREGLRQCRELGCQAVVVLGQPEYYPRFGFVPAVRHLIRSEYDVPDNVFMVAELEAGALRGVSGIARYHEAFSSV
jgi:putative acetyltransferase